MLELNAQNMFIKSVQPGKGDSTAWEVAFAGEIDDGLCNRLYNDPRFASRVWDTQGKTVQLGEAWRRVKKIPCSDKYEGLATALEMGGDEFEFSDSRLSGIYLVPSTTSKIAIVNFKMQLQPQSDKAVLALCHYKNKPVKLSFAGGSLVTTRGEQQELPLSKGGEDVGPPDQNAGETSNLGRAIGRASQKKAKAKTKGGGKRSSRARAS
jgi:hypothetical protein